MPSSVLMCPLGVPHGQRQESTVGSLTVGGVWEIGRAKDVFPLRAGVLVCIVTGVVGGSRKERRRTTRGCGHEDDGADSDLGGRVLDGTTSVDQGTGNSIRHLVCR